MRHVRVLVFDLAGVLLDFGGPESVYAMSNGRVDQTGFFRFWSEAACARDLHCGRCSPEAFAREAVRELQLAVTPETFLADYKTWFRGPYEGALELLERLRPAYRTACLSNANALDVKRFKDELPAAPPRRVFLFERIGVAEARCGRLPARQQGAERPAR